MEAYFKLRSRLARAYPDPNDWRRAAEEIGVDYAAIDLDGSSLSAWANLLRAADSEHHLKLLGEFAARAEDPMLVQLVDAYVEGISQGFQAIPDLPELHALVLSGADTEPTRVARCLNFAETFPPALLEIAISGALPAGNDLDVLIDGENTARAKDRFSGFRDAAARELSTLLARQKSARLRLAELTEEIQTIERRHVPRPPTAPKTEGVSAEHSKLWYERYLEDCRRYERSLEAFKLAQDRLPSLQAELKVAARDHADFTSQIETQRTRTEAEERGFLADVATARDKDLYLKIDRILGKASTVCRNESNPFKAFWTILGASCFARLVRDIAQPSTVNQINDLLRREAESLTNAFRRGLSNIAKVSLAGPTILQDLLARNNRAHSLLMETLTKLPLSDLQRREFLATKLLDVSFPDIPSYEKLEDVGHIDRVKMMLEEAHASMVAYLAKIQDTLADEPCDIKRKVQAARSEVQLTITAMKTQVRSDEYIELLKRNVTLWKMIRRGYQDASLPEFVRLLCESLEQEVFRRFQVSALSFMESAAASEFGLKETEADIEGHVLTVYSRKREALQARSAQTEDIIAELRAGLAGLDTHLVRVAARHRQRMFYAAVLSAIPGVGVLASIWASALLPRIWSSMHSGKAAFKGLGLSTYRALVIGLAASAISAGGTIAFILTRVPFDLFDGAGGTLMTALGVLSLSNVILMLRNVFLARAYRSG
jgi:hypothetical protein